MFPVTLLTVTMFRNVNPPPQEEKLLRQWEMAVGANFNKSKAPAKASTSKASLATSEPESSSVRSKTSTDKQRSDSKQTDSMYTPKSTDSSKPESTSTFSSLFKPKKPPEDSSDSSVQTSKSPEPSDPETSSVYSEPSTRIDTFDNEGSVGMYTPKSNFTSENTSDEVPSATSRSDGNLTDEVEFQSVLEGDADVQRKVLPWWTVYISWALVMCASVAFTFVIILYTFTFGLQKSLQWLAVVTLSFFTGILIQEPLKVVATAIVIALIFKKSEEIQITNSDSITEDSVRGKGHNFQTC